MKKRIFIPISIGFILLNLLFWGLSVLIISIFILALLGKIDVDNIYLEAPIIFIGIIFLLYTSVRFLLAFKIHLRTEDVKTYGDMLPKFERIQYNTSIKYIDINNVAIVASEKNSLNKRIQLNFVSSSKPKKYLVFELINGRSKRMCIQYYNKRQIIRMLNYI